MSNLNESRLLKYSKFNVLIQTLETNSFNAQIKVIDMDYI